MANTSYTDEELKKMAIEIRDEYREGHNTALRVGTLFLALLDRGVDVESLHDIFLRKDQPDQTSHLLKLLGGMEVGQYKEGVAGGKIDEQGAAELKNLLVREGIESTNFNAGALGTGFMLKTDPETGRSYLEVDELLVRVLAVFVELEIRKLSYAGGNWVFSAAGGKCAKVEELEDVYRCYLAVDNGKTAVENEFRVDDQVRCQEFNVKPGVHQNVSNRYYWRLVVGVGEDYIDLSKTDCDAGSVAPLKGDDLVQLGNRTDVKRQNAIVISAYGEGSPSITQHKGINSYSLAGTEKTRISPDKNVFSGEFHFESGVSVEESVNKANNAASAAQGAANNAVLQVGALRTETSSKIEALNNKIALKVSTEIFDAENEKQKILAACTDANMRSDDPTFARGLNGISAYNNAAGSGAVSVARKSGCSVNLSNYYIDVSTAASGGVTPAFGGFTFNYQAKARCRLVCRFSAWLDKERTFEFATNPLGDGSRHFWLTSNKGAGTWASYAYYVECGTGGLFGTTFYFYVTGGGRPVSTWLSFAAIHQLDADADFRYRISYAETSITQLDNKISLKAEKSVVDNLGSRLSAAEVAIQPDNIWLKVSSKVNQVAVDASKRTDVWVDARNLNQNTYYPVTIGLATHIPHYRIIVSRTLATGQGVPSWSSHQGGFSLMVVWTTNAAGWGTIGVQRMVQEATCRFTSVDPVGNIGQLSNSSHEYIYVRGGSMYEIIVEGASGVGINLRTSTFTASEQSLAPLSSVTFPSREQPTKDEIKAGIGVTTGGVTVFGKTISLNGVVTFSSLASDAQGKINTAQSTANTAVSKADTAQSTADTARTELIERARLGKTLIDGGKIKTDLIDVNWIFARDITANSFHLKAGKIGAFTVDSRGLSNSDYSSYINIGNNTTRFVRINYDVDTLLAVRAQNESKRGVSISSDGAGCTALSITAQNGSIAIHSSGGHEFYQRKGEKWNTPGVLWAAKLRSDGSIENQWGNGLGDVNVSTGKHTVGHFYITHNLGRWDYFPIVTSELGNNNTRTSACVKNITTSGFEVQVTDMGDRYTDASIFVCIIGRNKW